MERVSFKHPITKETVQFDVRNDSSDIKGIREIFEQRSYQRPKMGFMPSANEVWIDGGGNVGAFSVYLSPIVKKIHCYECEPNNLEMISRNLALNNCKNVEVHAKALVPDSYKSDKALFYVNEDPNLYWRHSMLKFKRKSKEIAVRTERISVALERGINCVKIDIEGAEIPILLEKKKWNLDKLVFEWSFDADPRITVFNEAAKLLSTSFGTVKHAKMPEQELWSFFPAATNVFCMR